jgi:hypothetical protein
MRKAVALGIGATANGTIAFIGGAIAAETGRKTMPESSVYPPPTPAPVLETDHHWCYLPSAPCDNNHRDTN